MLIIGSCSDGGFGPHLCPQQRCVAPHPHQEVNAGVPSAPGLRVAAAEVKFTLQSISVGGRRERDQGQYWYYKLRVQTVQLYYCKQQKLEGEWSGNDRG